MNSFLSTQITVESGVQQGCALSPILVICAIKPLAQHLRQDPAIRGVHIPGSSNREAKILIYMDNLNILCQNRGLVERALAHTQVYEVVAGAKLNMNKSTCLAMGEVRDLESLGVSVPCEGIRILGVDFDPELSIRTVWEKTEAKVKQKLGLWHMHSSFMGACITVMKVVLLPVLLYTTLVFPPSKCVTHRIQRAVCVFFWGSR
ncbi:hypothetical protein Y1Q_0016152 [Alligator mississippiensis]|uniref:Reverse transcriptase domain-containing protein n=1 Tax=Alligator mississippiensis TaxID=8496 RepID=A0A151P0W3_ALLMI|nr:hypothetical protein Y1Q_0016152 [Alligator mississippiensis]